MLQHRRCSGSQLPLANHHLNALLIYPSCSYAPQVDGKKGSLEAWCKTAYGEAFSAWMHIAVVRLFVEAILRYGLPPTFQVRLLASVAQLACLMALPACVFTLTDGMNRPACTQL